MDGVDEGDGALVAVGHQVVSLRQPGGTARPTSENSGKVFAKSQFLPFLASPPQTCCSWARRLRGGRSPARLPRYWIQQAWNPIGQSGRRCRGSSSPPRTGCTAEPTSPGTPRPYRRTLEHTQTKTQRRRAFCSIVKVIPSRHGRITPLNTVAVWKVHLYILFNTVGFKSLILSSCLSTSGTPEWHYWAKKDPRSSFRRRERKPKKAFVGVKQNVGGCLGLLLLVACSKCHGILVLCRMAYIMVFRTKSMFLYRHACMKMALFHFKPRLFWKHCGFCVKNGQKAIKKQWRDKTVDTSPIYKRRKQKDACSF